MGCDGELQSNVSLDACLVCGGDGSGCSTLHGTVNTEHMPSGKWRWSHLVLAPDFEIVQNRTADTCQNCFWQSFVRWK